MIGLGSNRLSVCRRGGMSVTQAGKGGMEWLAGDGLRGRSPYSDLATAALKAQFPTQWPTIRDYGFAHPALVPFINEDPMMVCSLGIEGLPIRYIYGYNGGYAKTGYYYKNTDSIKIRCKYPRVSEDKKFFGSRGNGFGLCVISSAWRPLINGNFYTVGSLVTGRIYDIEFKQTASNTLFTDGTYSATYSRMNTTSAECFIFGLNNGGGGVEGQTPNFQMISAELGDSRKYIPITRDGNLELIDLVNGVLATRVGTFKEFYELPDGTPWSPAS